ncbi:related to enoyl-CoA hydratase/isomerase [Ramularia collo-cygni]|uniref:Related to enoyl-CoA hydratase/isomerase n=1 Tax=Ramularia collo-cygni TaxID=112498 RepID=A0A2D3UR78_9PEZI|nr:related to enoyl-CoA hydratase/isomerase [Ramularia collo-cygni]CZT16998.1 related to enoyl-CoA hydratase/isomerase [Ramularia collo-cygni]
MSLDILREVPSFLYRQLFTTPPTPTKDCTGKTIIVTGANVGLGKEAARHFVQLNAQKVIIACRSIEKGESAKEDIEASTGRKGVVEVWQLDLQSYDSVRAFAKRAESLDRLDILLENAGISTAKYVEVPGTGMESTIVVNVVATFLLALLMIPAMQKTSKKHNTIPTLTIVSSEVHFFTSFPERKASSIFATLSSKHEARMADRYNVSKMLEVLTCREIAKEHPVSQTNVTLNFVNPGFCHSELMRDMMNPILVVIKKILCRTTEVGSRTLVHAALSGPESHGKYHSDSQIAECARLVEGPEGPEMQRRVWGELSSILENIEPGVTKVLDN